MALYNSEIVIQPGFVKDAEVSEDVITLVSDPFARMAGTFCFFALLSDRKEERPNIATLLWIYQVSRLREEFDGIGRRSVIQLALGINRYLLGNSLWRALAGYSFRARSMCLRFRRWDEISYHGLGHSTTTSKRLSCFWPIRQKPAARQTFEGLFGLKRHLWSCAYVWWA